MGGGGGGSRSIGDLSQVSREAQEALSKERRNVFISFAYEDIDEVNLLRAQSKSDMTDIAFNDWSVSEPFDSRNADYVQRQITERIRQSSVTVVYVSADTAQSRWVAWEVEKSIELGKKVVAVHSGDVAPQPLPSFIGERGIPVVPWSRLAEELRK